MEDELQTTRKGKDIVSGSSLFISPSDKLSSIFHSFNRLLVICEISTMLLAFDHGQFNEEALFFSSLESVSTISDRLLRRLRGLLMVVSLDFTKLELLEDLSSTKSEKKPKKKSVSGKKGKSLNVKKSIPVQRSVQSNSASDKSSKVTFFSCICFICLFGIKKISFLNLSLFFFCKHGSFDPLLMNGLI